MNATINVVCSSVEPDPHNPRLTRGIFVAHANGKGSAVPLATLFASFAAGAVPSDLAVGQTYTVTIASPTTTSSSSASGTTQAATSTSSETSAPVAPTNAAAGTAANSAAPTSAAPVAKTVISATPQSS